MHRLLVICALVALCTGAVACGDDTANDAANKARDAAQSAKDQAAEKAREAAQTAKDKVSGAVTKVSGRQVSVAMTDFKFTPSRLSANSGKFLVSAKNEGKQPHEFVLLRTDKAPDALPVENGRVSEANSVGEISEREPGKRGVHAFDLKAGKYVFVCNVEGHYQAGMRGSLTVK